MNLSACETVSSGQSLPYVLVRLKDRRLAISSADVREVLLMPPVSALPGRAPAMRGVVNIRGEVIPLLDLRIEMGMTSALADIEQMAHTLDEREQDHRNWLAELDASAREKRPFGLARDPHKCKFGKWYDTYKPEQQAITFMALWRSFDEPHRRIHAVADSVCRLVSEGQPAAAAELIQRTRNRELRQLIDLFAEAKATLRQCSREVAVVLRRSGRQLAVCVDEVSAVERLDPSSMQPLPPGMGAGAGRLTPQVARKGNSGPLVLVADVDRLFSSACAAA